MLKLMKKAWNDYLCYGFHPVFAPVYAAIGGGHVIYALHSWLAKGLVDWGNLTAAAVMIVLSFYLTNSSAKMASHDGVEYSKEKSST